MRETVAIEKGERFMAITEHAFERVGNGAFLGIDRSEDLVQIQVFPQFYDSAA
jgi:4-oxalocrotonate tautomerase